jgi:TolB-like protein
MKRIYFILAGLLSLLIAGCSSLNSFSADAQALDSRARWALLPIVNNTDTPQAGLSAEAMLEHVLLSRGITNLTRYPASLSRDSLFEPTERKASEEAQKWARDQGLRYALTGSVEEWRYKVGIDGEPAVGVTLKVLDLSNGRVLWSASGAKSGWSREALASVAQSLIVKLMSTLSLTSPGSNG